MDKDGTGTICSVQDLPIEELCETSTFRNEWPESLRKNTRKMFKILYQDLPRSPVSDPSKGSCDPFLAFNKDILEKVGKSIFVWFKEQGKQTFNTKERQAWEGQNVPDHWQSYLPQLEEASND